MKVNTYVRVATTLYLEGEETFETQTQDKNAFGFEVNQITWSGGDWVTLKGPGISRRDGQRLSVYRTDNYRSFFRLTSLMQDKLKDSRREAILALTKELDNV